MCAHRSGMLFYPALKPEIALPLRFLFHSPSFGSLPAQHVSFVGSSLYADS